MESINKNYLKGFIYAVLAVFFMSINDCIVKKSTDLVSVSYILLYKQYYTLMFYIIWCLWKRTAIIPKVKYKKLMFYFL